jgi:adenosylmethionine---8-amino-7-oxononanoate aminotransferase
MPTTEELLELERRHVWPPFTQAKAFFAQPHPIISRGEGVFLFDTEGKRYYDAFSSWWVNIHGHNHPELNRTLAEQAGRLAHTSMAGQTNDQAIQLAAELAAMAPPGLGRIFFSDNGSTAVEVAMKMAFQYFQNVGEPRRTRFAAFSGAYHGDTLGAVAVGGIDLFHGLFKPIVIPVVRTPAPECGACPHGRTRTTCEAECFEAIAQALLPHAEELCAVIIEPLIQAAVGMRMYSPQVLRALRAFCDAHGILLIDDEVAMAFGRTGATWAFEHAGIVPDIVCAAKGLTAGYLPMAVTLTSPRIFEAFYGEPGDTRALYHGHSFTGNPLAAAVARASLRLFREERLPELPEKVEAFGQMMAEFAAQPWARDGRCLGMVGAFELAAPDGNLYDPVFGMGRRVSIMARDEGVYLRPLADTVYIMPPLSITLDELTDMAARIERAIHRAMATV